MLETIQDKKEYTEDTLEANNDGVTANTTNLDNETTDNDEKDFESSIFESTDSTSETPEVNCLALTVKKDYNLVVVKNIFTKSGRLSLKILLITTLLHLLNLLF